MSDSSPVSSSLEPVPGPQRPAARRSAVAARLARLCLKELREILRDRRTIVTLVFMPLLVYPLLSITFSKFLYSSLSSIEQLTCRVGVVSEEEADRLYHVLNLGQVLLREQGELAGAAADSGGADAEPTVSLEIVPNLPDAVASGSLDAAVVLLKSEPIDPRVNLPEQFHCQILYRSDSALSKTAVDYLQRRLRMLNESYIAKATGYALPAKVRLEAVSGGVGTAYSLTTLVPLILILMTITGAVYPAIDLTAGERERGTLETLMSAPVPRLGLLVAKFVAVLTVALFTATANLAAMTVTLWATGLVPVIFGEAGLTHELVAQVFFLLILFATFFSAILLAITCTARSFKEAQAYLIPVMLLSLAPGIMSLVPDLQFNGLLAVTPLVNIVLLARDIFEGTVQPQLATAAVLSTGLYAIAALGIAARIFGTDAILYGGQATWADLLSRPHQRRSTASIPGSIFCLAAMFPPYFLLANLLHRLPQASMAVRLTLSASVTALLFAVLPLAAALFQKTRLRTAFQFQPASVLAFLAALVLGVSLWPFAHELFLLNQFLGISSLNQQRLEAVEELLAQWRTLSPLVILLTMAVTPAVCEEFFFRGYLMGAFRHGMQRWTAIVSSAILFGAFHIVSSSVLSAERFLPSTFMGLVLGWVCYRTGSVLPGMLLHASHNGLLLMLAYYRHELEARGWGVQEQTHLPGLWLLVATGVVIFGIGLVLLSTRQPRQPVAESAATAGD